MICEIMNEDGTMAKGDDLFKFAKKHKLKIAKIEDLISYRLKREKLIKLKKTTQIQVKKQIYKILVFENQIDSEIKVVSSENANTNQDTEIKIPEINAGRSLVLLTIAGILYQIKRSENLKYLGLKFFFVPMYSRLQKDTLTD